MSPSAFNDPHDIAFTRGTASSVARSIRLRVEAQRGQHGGSADNRQKQRWTAQLALADHIEACGDEDAGVAALAAVNRARGGGFGPAQETCVGRILSAPGQKAPPASHILFAALVNAACDDLAEHARSIRDDMHERDLAAALRDLGHASERLQSVEAELHQAHERETAHHEHSAAQQQEIDDLRARLAGVVDDHVNGGEEAMARLAVQAARREAKAKVA